MKLAVSLEIKLRRLKLTKKRYKINYRELVHLVGDVSQMIISRTNFLRGRDCNISGNLLFWIPRLSIKDFKRLKGKIVILLPRSF